MVDYSQLPRESAEAIIQAFMLWLSTTEEFQHLAPGHVAPVPPTQSNVPAQADVPAQAPVGVTAQVPAGATAPAQAGAQSVIQVGAAAASPSAQAGTHVGGPIVVQVDTPASILATPMPTPAAPMVAPTAAQASAHVRGPVLVQVGACAPAVATPAASVRDGPPITSAVAAPPGLCSDHGAHSHSPAPASRPVTGTPNKPSDPEDAITSDMLHELDVDILEGLSARTKHRLNRSMTKVQHNALNDEQAAALDIYRVIIPTLGPVNSPVTPLQYRGFETPKGAIHFDISPVADERYYAVIVGIGFTGLVCGLNNYTRVAPGSVKGVKGVRGRNRAHAEALWRRAAYKGETSTIKQPPPPPPPTKTEPFIAEFMGPDAE